MILLIMVLYMICMIWYYGMHDIINYVLWYILCKILLIMVYYDHLYGFLTYYIPSMNSAIQTILIHYFTCMIIIIKLL